MTIKIRNSDGQMEDVLVVDADVHLHESPGEMAQYCPMPWRRALENVANVPERYIDLPGFSPGGSGSSYEPPFPGGLVRRFVHTPEQMGDELAEIGVDIGVLFPDHLLKLAMLPNSEYAVAVAQSYNDWMVDRWLGRDNGLRGAIAVAPQDPEAGAREIERLTGVADVVAVFLSGTGVDPLYGHRRYDPIYDAAQSAGLPVVLHSVGAIHPAFPWNLHGFDTTLAKHAVGHTFSMIANLVSMVTTGVPVRFPKLKICFEEAGISWVPFVRNRLDKEYLERRREVPFLTQRPSKYIEQMYFATQPIEEPEDLSELATLIQLYRGENTTLFASDWPHHDFDHPNKVAQIPMPFDLKRKLFGANAVEFFRNLNPVAGTTAGRPTAATSSAGVSGDGSR